MIRILLADDDDLVRAGMRLILEGVEGLAIVGESADGRSAVRDARDLEPDVVLMDIQMPDIDGIEATRRINAVDDPPRVIIVTTFELDRYVFEALRAGAAGFLLKRTSPRDLIDGIRIVAEGEALLAPSVTRRLIEEFAVQVPADPSSADRLELLTEREIETLAHVAEGRTNAEIADLMFVSESTAKTHLRRTLMKLGLRDRIAAVIFAYDAGLVRPGKHSSLDG